MKPISVKPMKPISVTSQALPRIPLKTNKTGPQIPVPAHSPMLPSWSNMRHTTGTPPLSSIQQCVAGALAAGPTLSNAAQTYGIHRVTSPAVLLRASGLCNVRNCPRPAGRCQSRPDPGEPAPTPAESTAAATECNTMQHDSGNSGGVASVPPVRRASAPAPCPRTASKPPPATGIISIGSKC